MSRPNSPEGPIVGMIGALSVWMAATAAASLAGSPPKHVAATAARRPRPAVSAPFPTRVPPPGARCPAAGVAHEDVVAAGQTGFADAGLDNRDERCSFVRGGGAENGDLVGMYRSRSHAHAAFLIAIASSIQASMLSEIVL